MRLNRARRSLAALLLLLVPAGCQQPLRTYPDLTAGESIEILRARFAGVETVSGGCIITLRSASGESVNLDGALAAKNPGWLRIRAWKFDSAVFDATVTPDGRWLYIAEDAQHRSGNLALDVTAAHIADAWALINGGFFEQPLRALSQNGDAQSLVLRADHPDGAPVLCTIDRRTLTARQYAVLDETGAVVFRVDLDNYQSVNGFPWAHRLVMQSARGRIVIECADVEINGALNEMAFVPPRLAVKQP